MAPVTGATNRKAPFRAPVEVPEDTTMSAVPAAWGGAVATMDVLVTEVTAAGEPPIETAACELNPTPVRVITLPPSVEPRLGCTDPTWTVRVGAVGPVVDAPHDAAANVRHPAPRGERAALLNRDTNASAHLETADGELSLRIHIRLRTCIADEAAESNGWRDHVTTVGADRESPDEL